MTWLERGQLSVETNIMMALIHHFHVPMPLQENCKCEVFTKKKIN